MGTLRCREALGCLQPPLLPSIAWKARSRPPQGFPVVPLCGVVLWELTHGRSTPGGPPRGLQPEVVLSQPRRISALSRQPAGAGEEAARGGARGVCACACACAAAAPASLQVIAYGPPGARTPSVRTAPTRSTLHAPALTPRLLCRPTDAERHSLRPAPRYLKIPENSLVHAPGLPRSSPLEHSSLGGYSCSIQCRASASRSRDGCG